LLFLSTDIVTASGWGETERTAGTDGDFEVNLAYTNDLELIDNDDCKNKRDNEDLTDFHICAEPKHSDVDVCRGDSGGPLTVTSIGDVPKLVGIVSYGDVCPDLDGSPGVYTYALKYYKWITDRTYQEEPICPRNYSVDDDDDEEEEDDEEEDYTFNLA